MDELKACMGRAVRYIARLQRPDGSIPFDESGALDPWDLVECAMALDVGGYHGEAEAAYLWLREAQNEDGSFWSCYEEGVPVNLTRDTNLSTYLAVGLWHHFLITKREGFLRKMWPSLVRAVEFALGMQQASGLIYWAKDHDGRPWPDSLVAGSSSIRAALLCAERIARVLGHHSDLWRRARTRLENALQTLEHQMGKTLPEDESLFAMHWYYPVLCGVVKGEEGRKRLRSRLREFIHPGLGARCRSDRPWVTVAESCELAMALDAVGLRGLGRLMLHWQLKWQDAEGRFRMGTVPLNTPWPDGHHPTWTAAAVVLALDCLYDCTAASGLFRSFQREE